MTDAARARPRRAACSSRAARCSCCCRAGATRSACSTSPSGSPARRTSPRCTSTTALRAGAGDDEAHCAALCERLGVELHVRRPRRPAGAGNLQAWARDVRYAEAAMRARRRRRRRRPHRDRPGRDRALPARRLARPPRAARHGGARGAARAAAARRDAATRPPRTAPPAAWPGARTPPTTSAAFARSRVRHDLLPAPARDPPGRRGERAAHARAAARRGRGARRESSTPRSREAGDPPAVAALARAPARPAPARGAAAGRPRVGRPAPAIGHRTAEVLALREGGALDVGDGLRAEIRGGALRFGASRGPAAPRRAAAPS